MNRPPPGTLVWWRYKGATTEWIYGYCTYVQGPTMIRLGAYNGDTTGGKVVDCNDIEWQKCKGTEPFY